MSDARPLAAAYAASGGEAIFCKLSRRSLPWPKEEHYLDLFDVVNRAALEAMTLTRKPFSTCYRIALKEYLARTPAMASMLKQHVRMLLTTQATAIADTGMQGTFALALAALIEDLSERRMEVHLAVAYPWLTGLLDLPAVSDDASVLTSLEAIAHEKKAALDD